MVGNESMTVSTWVLVMVVTVTSCRLLAWLPPELRVPHPDTTA